MKRFLDYYRQFEELPPEEVSRELRARRDEEKARALAELPALDLASAAWHEPPHAEIVNAATFALRRAVNAYPDPKPAELLAALAARHGVEADQVAAGHGAGELMRAACHALLAGGGRRRGADRLARLGAAAAAGPRGRRRCPCRSGSAATGPRTSKRCWRRRARTAARSRSRARTTRRAATIDAARAAPARRRAAGRHVDPARRRARRLRGPGRRPRPAHARARPPARVPQLLEGARDGRLPRRLRDRPGRRGRAARPARSERSPSPPRRRRAWPGPPRTASATCRAAASWPPRRSAPARRRAGRDRARLPGRRRPAALALLGEPRRPGPRRPPRQPADLRPPGNAWGDDRHVRVALRGGDATDRLVEALLELVVG